jgi:hypothetical protein
MVRDKNFAGEIVRRQQAMAALPGPAKREAIWASLGALGRRDLTQVGAKP